MHRVSPVDRFRLPRSCSLPVWLRRLVAASILTTLLVWVPLNLTSGVVLPTSVFQQAELVAQPLSFSIVRWEVGALGGALLHRIEAATHLASPPAMDDRALVEQYFSLGQDLTQLRSDRDRTWAVAGQANGNRADLVEIESRIRLVEQQRADLAPWVQDVIAGQISAELRELGLREGYLEWGHGLLPVVEPDVFFTFSQLPNAFVVAPRDKIEIRSSLLLEPDLTTADLEALEDRVDALGVSSLAFGVGGFAAYPSMLPDTTSLRGTLQTVAHEWTHHYLAFRPLGQAYFADYRMRSINETVADIVGTEVGNSVYHNVYAPNEPLPQPAVPRARTSRPSGPDFGQEMRRIRAEVERLLATGDVAGAEAYMAQQKDHLAQLGFYVRKLNTAYLAFFGSYSGGGNPWEPKLRSLRQRSGSLEQFLETVSEISTPEQLDQLSGS